MQSVTAAIGYSLHFEIGTIFNSLTACVCTLFSSKAQPHGSRLLRGYKQPSADLLGSKLRIGIMSRPDSALWVMDDSFRSRS